MRTRAEKIATKEEKAVTETKVVTEAKQCNTHPRTTTLLHTSRNQHIEDGADRNTNPNSSVRPRSRRNRKRIALQQRIQQKERAQDPTTLTTQDRQLCIQKHQYISFLVFCTLLSFTKQTHLQYPLTYPKPTGTPANRLPPSLLNDQHERHPLKTFAEVRSARHRRCQGSNKVDQRWRRSNDTSTNIPRTSHTEQGSADTPPSDQRYAETLTHNRICSNCHHSTPYNTNTTPTQLPHIQIHIAATTYTTTIQKITQRKFETLTRKRRRPPYNLRRLPISNHSERHTNTDASSKHTSITNQQIGAAKATLRYHPTLSSHLTARKPTQNDPLSIQTNLIQHSTQNAPQQLTQNTSSRTTPTQLQLTSKLTQPILSINNIRNEAYLDIPLIREPSTASQRTAPSHTRHHWLPHHADTQHRIPPPLTPQHPPTHTGTPITIKHTRNPRALTQTRTPTAPTHRSLTLFPTPH